MHYNHLCIGHPVMMRRIIRDCLISEPVPSGDTNDNEADMDYEETGEGYVGCSDDDGDDQEVSNEELSGEELVEDDCEGDEDDDDDLPSF
jgi:hypothetical protein